MLTVNLASAQKHLKEDEAALKTLAEVDWSAASDKFQICVAAVREDVDRVVELMPRVSATNELEKSEFRDWPVLAFIRKEERFKNEFERIFGEPIDLVEKTTKTAETVDEAGTSKTVH